MPSTTPSQFDPEAYLASLDLLGSYEPQRMYLTHYGELAYSPEKAQLLAQQIVAYCQFASEDHENLQQQLTDYSMNLLRQFGARASDKTLRERLIFDLQLNTQGLQVWKTVSRTSSVRLSDRQRRSSLSTRYFILSIA